MVECTHDITDRYVICRGGEVWPGVWLASSTPKPHNHCINYAALEMKPNKGHTNFKGCLEKRNTHHALAAISTTACQGFAWDFREYDGIELVIGKSDGKLYVLAVTDATGIRFEGSFRVDKKSSHELETRVVLRFRNLVPMNPPPGVQRPPELQRAPEIDRSRITGFRIDIDNDEIVREGNFRIAINRIQAVMINCGHDIEIDPVVDRYQKNNLRQKMQNKAHQLKNSINKAAVLSGVVSQKGRPENPRPAPQPNDNQPPPPPGYTPP